MKKQNWKLRISNIPDLEEILIDFVAMHEENGEITSVGVMTHKGKKAGFAEAVSNRAALTGPKKRKAPIKFITYAMAHIYAQHVYTDGGKNQAAAKVAEWFQSDERDVKKARNKYLEGGEWRASGSFYVFIQSPSIYLLLDMDKVVLKNGAFLQYSGDALRWDEGWPELKCFRDLKIKHSGSGI